MGPKRRPFTRSLSRQVQFIVWEIEGLNSCGQIKHRPPLAIVPDHLDLFKKPFWDFFFLFFPLFSKKKEKKKEQHRGWRVSFFFLFWHWSGTFLEAWHYPVEINLHVSVSVLKILEMPPNVTQTSEWKLFAESGLANSSCVSNLCLEWGGGQYAVDSERLGKKNFFFSELRENSIDLRNIFLTRSK